MILIIGAVDDVGAAAVIVDRPVGADLDEGREAPLARADIVGQLYRAEPGQRVRNAQLRRQQPRRIRIRLSGDDPAGGNQFRHSFAYKSTPHASLDDNTTWHLVEDIEKREALRFKIAHLQEEMLARPDEAISTYSEILADDDVNLRAIAALDDRWP